MKDADQANFMNIHLHFTPFKCIQFTFGWVVGVPLKVVVSPNTPKQPYCCDVKTIEATIMKLGKKQVHDNTHSLNQVKNT